jgi:hypothetical protein
MISKQLNFFHTINELQIFIDFFKNKGFNLLPYLVENLDKIEQQDQFLYNQNRIEIVFDYSRIDYKFIEKQNYYLIDAEKSYVVEFLLCSISKDNKFESGRLYFTPKYYEEGEFRLKNNIFINEANNLLKEFKKNFLLKTEYSGSWFFTKEVQDLFKNNLAEWTQNNNVVKLKS